MKTHFLGLLAALLPACTAIDSLPIDEPVELTDPGKADGLDPRHYLLTSIEGQDWVRSLRRAGGGELRCPDGVVREACEITESDLTASPGLATNNFRILDELEDRATIARGRMVREPGGTAYLYVTAVTRAVTTVRPQGSCYRIRVLATPAICGPDSDPLCFDHRLERLDTPEATDTEFMYLDEVDPTPDMWGQPTPAVEALIDEGLRIALTRPVYTCGGFNWDPNADWFYGNQLFVPRT